MIEVVISLRVVPSLHPAEVFGTTCTSLFLYFSAPSQAPNLAATLQAAAHGVTGTSTHGVRLSSMMVTVDPNRHPSIVQHANYTTTAEGKRELVQRCLYHWFICYIFVTLRGRSVYDFYL